MEGISHGLIYDNTPTNVWRTEKCHETISLHSQSCGRDFKSETCEHETGELIDHSTTTFDFRQSPDIIRQIKSRRMRWAGHVARRGERRNVYRVLVGKL
jgi:hypothetical protein